MGALAVNSPVIRNARGWFDAISILIDLVDFDMMLLLRKSRGANVCWMESLKIGCVVSMGKRRDGTRGNDGQDIRPPISWKQKPVKDPQNLRVPFGSRLGLRHSDCN